MTWIMNEEDRGRICLGNLIDKDYICPSEGKTENKEYYFVKKKLTFQLFNFQNSKSNKKFIRNHLP